MPVEGVTRGGDQTQDTRGQFQPDAYKNQSKAVGDLGPLSELNLPQQNTNTPAPQGATLAFGNFAQAPGSFDVGPLQQGIANVQKGFAQYDENKQAQAALEQKAAEAQAKSVANTYALNHREEALQWALTGKDAQGNLISEGDLLKQQRAQALAAGSTDEDYRLASGDAYQIIKQRGQEAQQEAHTAQKALDKGIRDQRVSSDLLQFQTLSKDRSDPLTGSVDVHQGLNQLYDLSDQIDDPLTRQDFLEAGTKRLMEETKGDPKRELLMNQITTAEHRKQELILQGENESVASDRVRSEMIAKGADSTELAAYLANSNGEKYDQERLKTQMAQEKTASKESIKRFVADLDPTSLDSVLFKIPNVRSTANIRRALTQEGSQKSITLRDNLQVWEQDAKEQTDRAAKIFKLEGTLKETQNPKAGAAPQQKAGQQAVFAEMVTRGKIPADILTNGAFSKDAFTPDGKSLSDKARVYLGDKSETLRLMLAQTGKNYFNPDGSFTPDGSKRLRPFMGGIPHDVYTAITSPKSAPVEGTGKTPWAAKVEATQEELGRARAEFDTVQNKYKRQDGKNFDAFPTLDQRRRGYVYKNNVEAFITDTAEGFAGGSKVLSSASKAIGTLNSGNVDSTDNGRRACAWAVSQVLKRAGVPVQETLSTTELNAQFKNGLGTPTTWRGAKAGDVVISPTEGGKVGHTGICMTDGCTAIASNSGNYKVFQQNFNKESWIADLQDSRGLPTYIYHPKGDPQAQRQQISQQVQVHGAANTMQALLPVLVQEAKKKGIPPSFMIAQAMHETGYGTSRVAKQQNNFFGVTNNGEGTGYRSYGSAEESIADQGRRLTSGRYAAAKGLTGEAFVNKIHSLGYATDTKYADKINKIIRDQGLTKYDPPRQVTSGYKPRAG